MEAASAPSSGRRGVWGWLDERLGIGGLRYPVPKHANSLAFTLGGITLVSFVLLVVTGIYLAQVYDPTPERAHASVVYITDTAFAGELVRSLHYWLASAFVVTLVLHMVRAARRAGATGDRSRWRRAGGGQGACHAAGPRPGSAGDRRTEDPR
jgi:hypothetical protein